MTTAQLLEQWREATRAAELADRLAKMAAHAVERADADVVAAQEIAEMAERAAEAAERAAETARRAAKRAIAFASEMKTERDEAAETVTRARGDEGAARTLYHDAETEARQRHSQGGDA